VTPFEWSVRHWVVRARRLLSSEADVARRATVTQKLGAAHIYSAEWEPAHAAALEAMELARSQGEQRTYSEAAMTLAHALSIRGDLQTLIATTTELRSVAGVTGDRQVEGVAAALQADAHARIGELAEAAAMVRSFSDWLDMQAIWTNYVLGQGIRASVTWRCGDHALGETMARDALARHEELLAPVFWSHCGIWGMVEVLIDSWAIGGGAEREAFAKRAVRQIARNGAIFRFSKSVAAWSAGRLAQVGGRRAAAERALWSALDLSVRDGLRLVEARTRIDLGGLVGGVEGDVLRAQGEAAMAMVARKPSLAVEAAASA